MVSRRRFYAGPATTQNVATTRDRRTIAIVTRHRVSEERRDLFARFYSGIRLVRPLLSFVSAPH